MSEPSSPQQHRERLRAKIIGLGERSIRKSYYPELQDKLKAVSQMNECLERRVQERTAQLRALANDLTETEQRERRRLAQMLHDQLQQILVAARFRLDVVRRRAHDAAMARGLDQIGELLDQALTESRSLTVELSPPVLYDAGLAAGLEWLARQAQQRYDLRVQVEVEPGAEAAAEGLAVFLFQIAQELLLNVVKHAEARSAAIRLARRAEGPLELVVSDSGIGFDPQQAERQGTAGGFGLFSISERLTLLGGRLEIDAAPGRGARLSVVIPPAAKAAALDESPSATPPVTSRESPTDGVAVLPTTPRVRVLLADDHPLLRKGLADLLGERPEIEIVGEACDGQEAVDLALRMRPDVVLMDVTMPRLNGVEATRRIMAQLPGTRVVGLSMHEGRETAAAMREAGAAAYVSKGEPADTLWEAVLAGVELTTKEPR